MEGYQRSGNLCPGALPELKTDRYPDLPEKLTFLHAEDILDMFPDLPRKDRETETLKQYPAIFIYGIGWVLKDGYPHELRAADYDDWVTETVSKDGRPMHGLNGDILVWNPVTKRRHELTSMGVRVNAEALRKQLELTGQLDFLRFPYHQAILNDEIPLSIGGGIGQSRTQMLLLKKAHLGEVTVSVWPKVFKDMCRRKNIPVLDLRQPPATGDRQKVRQLFASTAESTEGAEIIIGFLCGSQRGLLRLVCRACRSGRFHSRNECDCESTRGHGQMGYGTIGDLACWSVSVGAGIVSTRGARTAKSSISNLLNQ